MTVFGEKLKQLNLDYRESVMFQVGDGLQSLLFVTNVV